MRRHAVHCQVLLILIVFMMVWSDFPSLLSLRVYAAEREGPRDRTAHIDRAVEENRAGVVHIEVIRREDVAFPFWYYEMTQLLEKPPHLGQKTAWQNTGTGVLLDEQGHILTNYHIAGSAKEIQVFQRDGRIGRAVLVGADPKTDLAVIQILIRQPLRSLFFAHPNTVATGERVVTIGYGSRPKQIFDKGAIRKCPKQETPDIYTLHDLIQINIPVDSENTGGPLINLQGKVVGINSALMTRFSVLEGTGFAIPGHVAQRIARRLIENGTVERGWLGAAVHDVMPFAADAVGLQRPEGARITHVVKGGPADQAGLKPGDVVTRYDDQTVSSGKHLQRKVAQTPPGEKVSLTVFRNKNNQRLSVAIGNPNKIIRDPSFFVRSRLGVDVRPVTPKDADHYNLDTLMGVVIVGVSPSGPMDEVGFESKDVIVGVEGKAIRNPKDFTNEIVKLRGKKRVIMLGLDHRTGRKGFVQVRVP